MRVKGGFTKRRGHKKVLSLTKGQRMGRRRLFRQAHEALLHAGQYAFAGRKLRRRNLRELWIQRINAAVREYDLSYSTFAGLLKKSKIGIDRKMLAQLAVKNQDVFKTIVEKVREKQ